MAYKIFLDGGAGTTGLQIADRLASRTDISLLVLDDATRKDKQARKAAMTEADISILCLPDAAAIEATAMAAELGKDVRLIDASSAHRVHPDFVYGFAEMATGQADKIANARLVSNPGCYPTSFVALVRPLIEAGLLAPDSALIKVGDAGGLDKHNFLVAEALAGRDNMEIFVFADASESHFVLTARTDNLGKGAAGAAVQNMNLMLGVDMLSGLQV